MPKKRSKSRSSKKAVPKLALAAVIILAVAAATLLLCGTHCCFDCGSSPTGAATSGQKAGGVYEYFYNGSGVTNATGEEGGIGVLGGGSMGGGDGSPGNPWQITSWTELNAMRDNGGASYILMNDLSSADDDYAGIGDNWTPIGTWGYGNWDGQNYEYGGAVFTGTFDGGNHIISDLIINQPLRGGVGLFGFIEGMTEEQCIVISNLGLVNVNVTGHSAVGALVGDPYHSREWATNCPMGSAVVITNCFSTGSVAGSDDCEYIYDEQYGEGYYLGSSSIGGLVGVEERGTTISDSFSTAGVSGATSLGGLVGVLNGNCNVINSFSTGRVISSCAGLPPAAYLDVGGLTGRLEGGVTNSYWNTETSGQATSAGGEGKTIAEMQDPSTYVGWDFDNVWEITNGLFPTLRTMPFYPCGNGAIDIGAGEQCDDGNRDDGDGCSSTCQNEWGCREIAGDGTPENPYQITSWTQLNCVRDDLTASYALMNDLSSADEIDYAGIGNNWTPIGGLFRGNFYGNGHTISDLTGSGGLFGSVGWYDPGYPAPEGIMTEISNLGLINVNITGTGEGAGAIAGMITQTAVVISNCFSTGSVSDSSVVGGLVGSWSVGGYYSLGSSAIYNSFSTADVSTSGYAAGGLVGYSGEIIIYNSYSTGSVSGSGFVGGLVGWDYDSRSIVTNSYWNTETSGQSTSAGGEGKTTAEMKDPSTYVGWDFDGTWEINGGLFPTLRGLPFYPCGNGAIEIGAGEQCDDGNTEDGDGCSSTCQNEAIAACGNEVIENSPVEFTHSDYGDEVDCIAPDVCFTRGAEGGAIYNTQDGLYRWACGQCGVETSPYFNIGDYGGDYNSLWRDLRDNCWGSNSDIPGKDTCLYINSIGQFIDVHWNSWTVGGAGGGFSYTKGPREQCDDGNRDDGDGCSSTCQNECVDADGDGYNAIDSLCPTGDDCDDSDANNYPGNTEVCDGNDNNCDTNVDEGLDYDSDSDSYYDPSSCIGGDDCDDGDPAINPGATEVCDSVDNNCDTNVDEGLTFDNDGDGYTDPSSCEGSKDDCDDSNYDINPGATEVCDGVDNNCDGYTDEGLDYDNDGDGYYDPSSCIGGDDCNDGDYSINPGATEVCDGVDNNCDGSTDEGNVCCGNGVTDPGEECDYDNAVDGDCCNPDCTFVATGILCKDIDQSLFPCFADSYCTGALDMCPPAPMEPTGTPCPDGTWCNGDETCDNSGNCQAGTTVDCDDSVDCTIDSCDEGTDSCDNTANDDNCEDGLVCNGIQFCDQFDGCRMMVDPPNCDDSNQCTDDSCSEAAHGCVNTNDDTNACDDGFYCTIGDACSSGSCSGSANTCSDGIDCTDDSCNEDTDRCDNIEIDADNDTYSLCDDDCNDTNDAIKPGEAELYDGIDQDCDTFIDEGFVVGQSAYPVTVGGSAPVTPQVFAGDQDIVFSEDGQIVMEFTHNFDEDNLNLSAVTIDLTTNSLLVNLHGQLPPGETKTLRIRDNNFHTLCIKDAEVASISAVSKDCNGADEMIFNKCLHNLTPVTVNGVTCTYDNGIITVSGLHYSAIVGVPAVPVVPEEEAPAEEGGAVQGYILTPPPSTELPEPEQPPAEQPPAEQPPAEQPPAEQPEQPVETPPAIEKPAFRLPSLEQGWYWYVLIIVVFAGVAFSMSRKAKKRKN